MNAVNDITTVLIKERRRKRRMKIHGLNSLHKYTVLSTNMRAAPEELETSNNRPTTDALKFQFELLLFRDKFTKTVGSLQSSVHIQNNDLINRFTAIRSEIKTLMNDIIALQSAYS